MQFLEAKGLSSQEIDLAFRQAATAHPYQAQHGPAQGSSLYNLTSPPTRWDWRDYFVCLRGFGNHILNHLATDYSRYFWYGCIWRDILV